MISFKVMQTVDQTIKSEEAKEMITLQSLLMAVIIKVLMTSSVMKEMISSKVAEDQMISKVDLVMMK